MADEDVDKADPSVAAKLAEERDKERVNELEEERKEHMTRRFSDERRPENLAQQEERAPGTVTPDDVVTASPSETLTEQNQQQNP